jgi:predicted nucleotidyltransferase
VAAVAEALGVPHFVGGALARDILLFHVLGLPVGRATRDIEVMVLVEDWAAFDALKERLVRDGSFSADARMLQRLHPGPSGPPLDILPFGPVEDPVGFVSWPPERDVVMTVVGFGEALRSARAVRLADELTVPVVALPVLSILKLTAWLDRHLETDKDAIDLLTMLRLYGAAGNEDRLFGDESEILAATGFDTELAGARLLGRDAVALCGADAVRFAAGRLPAERRRLLQGQMMRRSALAEDKGLGGRAESLFNAFWEELEAAAREPD